MKYYVEEEELGDLIPVSEETFLDLTNKHKMDQADSLFKVDYLISENGVDHFLVIAQRHYERC